MNNASRKFRRAADSPTNDTGVIENNSYNDQAGVRKVSDYGKALKPYNTGASFTTDFSTARILQMGTALAIYNKSGTLHAITFSDTSIAALAAGTTDVNGNVGIALEPNSWTYLNNYSKRYAITTHADCIVYEIDDDTHVVKR